jgi:hypothetical protein
MLVKLTAPHLIDDVLHDRDEVLNVDAVTPLMIGLDAEAEGAIRAEKVRVFGRWIGRWPNIHLLDDPPIERPIDDNRPVPPFGGGGPR